MNDRPMPSEFAIGALWGVAISSVCWTLVIAWLVLR
jgi:hypothetical protein